MTLVSFFLSCKASMFALHYYIVVLLLIILFKGLRLMWYAMKQIIIIILNLITLSFLFFLFLFFLFLLSTLMDDWITSKYCYWLIGWAVGSMAFCILVEQWLVGNETNRNLGVEKRGMHVVVFMALSIIWAFILFLYEKSWTHLLFRMWPGFIHIAYFKCKFSSSFFPFFPWLCILHIIIPIIVVESPPHLIYIGASLFHFFLTKIREVSIQNHYHTILASVTIIISTL